MSLVFNHFVHYRRHLCCNLVSSFVPSFIREVMLDISAPGCCEASQESQCVKLVRIAKPRAHDTGYSSTVGPVVAIPVLGSRPPSQMLKIHDAGNWSADPGPCAQHKTLVASSVVWLPFHPRRRG